MPADDSSMATVRLDRFSNPGYSRGASRTTELIWILVSGVFVASWLPGSRWRCVLLRAFGARIGRHVQVKPRLVVKYPWRLELRDHVWLGERVWFDNFDHVVVEEHCCISQGAYFCTSRHDMTDPAFSFIKQPIVLETGCWVGPGAQIAPGSEMKEGAVLAMGASAEGVLEPYTIYEGNPAVARGARVLVPRDG